MPRFSMRKLTNYAKLYEEYKYLAMNQDRIDVYRALFGVKDRCGIVRARVKNVR